MKALVICLTLCLAACSANPQRATPEAKPSPPPLIQPSPDVEPFFMRQALDVESRGNTRRIDAVVQYDGESVTTAFLREGRPVVLMVQEGTEADISGPGVSHVPFDLRWVMQEIGVALLLSPLVDSSKGGQSDQRDSEVGPVEDVWESGRLRRRVIAQTGTTIEYRWSDADCPARIVIGNEERDYRLEITTTQCGGATQ